jgi:S1-C subfamily serine protease
VSDAARGRAGTWRARYARGVKHSLATCASIAVICTTLLAFAQPQSESRSPQDGRDAATSAKVPIAPAPVASPTPEELYERIRRGVAVIERGGAPVAVGTVLGSDGRILTALSGLEGFAAADVRFADGSVVHAKVGHADKVTDLALLVPQALTWTDGLHASEIAPAGGELHAMLLGSGGRLGPTRAAIEGPTDAHSRSGEPLSKMLDVDIKGPLVAGAPLLDSTGGVVAVLVRACKGAAAQTQDIGATSVWAAWAAQTQPAKPAACAPAVFGAPVSTIRSFLAKAPPTATLPTPWLGIRGEPPGESNGPRGVRIVAVAAQSPAERSGLEPGKDVIVAVDSHPTESPEKLAEAIAKHAPGDTIKLLVFGRERFREVTVALSAAP